MVKFALAILLLLNSLTAAASRGRVVLLSSFESRHNREYWRSGNWDIETELAERFKFFFKNTGFDVQIVSDADQYSLWTALQASDVVAVYWISHAGDASSENMPGLRGQAIVLDHNRDNVVDLFRYPHPGLKWLSIIGCNTEYAVDEFRRSGAFRNNPDLAIDSESEKVEAFTAFDKTLERSWDVLKWLREVQEPKREATADGIHLKIRRTFVSSANPENEPAVRVRIDDEIIGVFPKGIGEVTQEIEVVVPRKQKFKLVFDSGATRFRLAAPELGTFTAETEINDSLSWRPFAKNGKPIGFSYFIYFAEISKI